MHARSVTSITQYLAEQRMERETWMAWRIRRYGYACLTLREVEAMQLEMFALAPHESGRQQETAVQKFIAARMGITQPSVSKLLASAERAMTYFAERGIHTRWYRVGGFWRLDAPVESRTFGLLTA